MEGAYERGRYSFTNFLGLAERSDYLEELAGNSYLPTAFFGGMPDCERVMLRVGSPETLGYEESWPIRLVEVTPKNKKFSDELTHRDFLGAIMSLGIERDRTGDILIDGKSAYVACVPDIAPYLAENLISVRHTAVLCQITECPAHLTTPKLEEHTASVASLRVDSVIAAVFRLSRQGAQNAVSAGYVFVNGRQVLSADRLLKEDDIVSLRHQGKFICRGQAARSRKGRCIVRYALYL